MGRSHKPLAMAAALVLLAGCGESTAPDDAVEAIRPPEIARIKSAQDALTGAPIRTLDPGTMNDAQIVRTIGNGPRCIFRYTSSGKPVLAMAMAPDGAVEGGVLKVNGHLVQLAPAAASGDEGEMILTADPIRIRIWPVSGSPDQEASLIFAIGSSLRVGYRGYLKCSASQGEP